MNSNESINNIRRVQVTDALVTLMSENPDIPFGELIMATLRRRNFVNPTKEPLQLTADLDEVLRAINITTKELRQQNG